MRFITLVIVANLFLSSKAAKFSLPLFQQPISSPPTRKTENGPAKFRIQDDGYNLARHHLRTFRRPVHGKYGKPFYYTTNITLGSPPQPFRILFDINWAEPFVPSAKCDSNVCKTFGYNSSASSTYVANGTLTDIFYPPVSADGHISSDTLALGEDLKVPLTFVELEHYDYAFANDEDLVLFDGVLGLAGDREWTSTNYGLPDRIPSCFRQMAAAGVLDANVFSIKLPRTPADVGDITFGGYDERLFKGELVKHPLFPRNTTLWRIGLDSMSMRMPGGSSVTELAKKADESQWVTQLMNRSPHIAIPAELAVTFHNNVPWKWSPCSRTFVVDCDSVPELPELTFGLGGQVVTLKGADYVEKLTPADYYCADPPEECNVMVSQTPDLPGYIDPDQVILGTSFLKKVYTVFDWDEKSVAFGKLAED